MNNPRILVLRGGAIGDFILTLPALRMLRQRWPKAYIEIVGYPRIASLAAEFGIVDKIVSLDKADIARLFSNHYSIAEDQCDYFKSFDFILSYLYDPFEVVQSNFRLVGVKQYIYGNPQVSNGHAIEHLLKPLESLALYPEGLLFPALTVSNEHVQRGLERLGNPGTDVVLIHPGSGSPKKNWLLGRFLDLAKMIRDKLELMPVFMVGEADYEISRELRKSCPDTKVISECSLIEIAEVIGGASVYIGNDSGITHLAAAVGVPVIALFGPSDPEVWGPRGPHVAIIRASDAGAEDLADIKVTKVFDLVIKALSDKKH